MWQHAGKGWVKVLGLECWGWAERIQGGAAGAPGASGSVQGGGEFLPGQLWRAWPDLAEVTVTQISMIIIVPRIHQALAVSQALV